MFTNQSNKEVVRRLFEEAFNKKNLASLPDLVAMDFTGSDGGKGPMGFQATVEPLFKAFPDYHYTITNLVGEDDKVAVSWTVRGTQTGPFRNIAPTGRSVVTDGIAIFVLQDGKIFHMTMLTDRLGFLQQLGVIPANP